MTNVTTTSALDNADTPTMDKVDKPRLGMLKIWMHYITQITVEPVTLMFVICFGITLPTLTAFIYQRVCHERFKNNSWVCSNLHNKTLADEENLVQADVSQFMLYMTLCGSIPPILLTFLYGILSDNYSGKLVMIIPYIGLVCNCVILILMAVYPSIPTWLILVGVACEGLGGYWTTLMMSVMSYVTIISHDNEERIIRIAILNAMWPFGYAVSLFIGGALLDNTSFVFVFSLILGIHLLTILYILVCIKDIQGNPIVKGIKHQINLPNVASIIKESFQRIIRKRPDNRRMHIILLYFIMICLVMGTAGKFNF